MESDKREKEPLSITHPSLVEEWDYEKNAPLKPNDVTAGSNKKAWWHDRYGHEWQASINHRSHGRGCPVCAKMNRGNAHISALIQKNGSLLDSNPHIAAEWHPTKNDAITPSEVTTSSGRKVWWLCEKGHEWESSIANRTSKGLGCPYCSNLKVLIGYNDLATTNPELAKEWDPVNNDKHTPYNITAGSNKDAFWVCPLGHTYKMRISHRKAGHGCPYCAGNKIWPGYNDLTTWAKKNNPRLLTKWNYEQNGPIPENESVFSSRIVSWKCDVCGCSYKNKISNECKSVLCPQCNKRNKSSFPEQTLYYYLKQLFPDAINGFSSSIISELDIYLPSINTGIEYDGKAWHDGASSYRKERRKYEVCQELGIRLIRFREKNVETKNAICDEIIASSYNVSLESFENEIRIFLQRYGKIDVDIRRDRNQIYELFIFSIREKSLQCLFPKIAKEWDFEKNKPITPDMIPAFINEEFYFLCPIGHSYKMVVAKRTSRGDGCPFCSGRRTIRGFNDLFTTNPELENEWDYEKNNIDPYSISKGYDKKIWWRCSKCGYSFSASPNTRTSQNSGCSQCKGGVSVKVNQYDLKGRFIHQFDSLSQAGKSIGVTSGAIYRACRELTPCMQYQWRYAKSEGNIGEYIKPLFNNKRVFQYDMNGRFIQAFDSVTIAKKKTGASKIGDVCNGHRKQSGGFIWKFADDAED